MPFPLLPRLITDELTDLSVEILKARNIQLLMMDFDIISFLDASWSFIRSFLYGEISCDR